MIVKSTEVMAGQRLMAGFDGTDFQVVTTTDPEGGTVAVLNLPSFPDGVRA